MRDNLPGGRITVSGKSFSRNGEVFSQRRYLRDLRARPEWRSVSLSCENRRRFQTILGSGKILRQKDQTVRGVSSPGKMMLVASIRVLLDELEPAAKHLPPPTQNPAGDPINLTYGPWSVSAKPSAIRGTHERLLILLAVVARLSQQATVFSAKVVVDILMQYLLLPDRKQRMCCLATASLNLTRRSY